MQWQTMELAYIGMGYASTTAVDLMVLVGLLNVLLLRVTRSSTSFKSHNTELGGTTHIIPLSMVKGSLGPSSLMDQRL